MSGYWDERDLMEIGSYLQRGEDTDRESQRFIDNAMDMKFEDAYWELYKEYSREDALDILARNYDCKWYFNSQDWFTAYDDLSDDQDLRDAYNEMLNYQGDDWETIVKLRKNIFTIILL